MSSSSPRVSGMASDRAAGPQRESRLYFPVGKAAGDYELWQGSASSLAEFCLDPDGERERYLADKRSIVQRVGRGPLCTGDAVAERAARDAERFVRARMLELPAWSSDTERLARLPLDALVLELQEDLAIMLCPAGHAPERARAVYLHVCFPSGWSPARLLGKSFPALHARVPYEPGFDRPDRTRHAAQLFDVPAARYVWSITSAPTLDRHPESAPSPSWQEATEAFLRVERQIIMPLAEAETGERSALFFIRTYVYPLARLCLQQRRTLIEAVEALPESVRRYKGMLGHESRLRQLVGC